MKKLTLAAAMEELNNETALTISNEGFIDNIKNAFNRAFTSNKKILKYLDSIDKKTAFEQSILKDVAWAKVFRESGSEINASDILNKINETQKIKSTLLSDSKKAISLIRKAATYCHGISKNLDTNTVKELISYRQELDNLYIDLIENYKPVKYDRKTTNVKTATDAEVKKIAAATKSFIINTSNDSEFEDLYKTIYSVSDLIHEVIVESELAYDTKNSEPIIVTTTKEQLKPGVVYFYINDILTIANNIDDHIYEVVMSHLRLESKIIHGAYMFLRVSLD